MSDTAKIVREIVTRAKSDIDGTVRGVEDKLKRAVNTAEFAAHEQIGKLQFDIKADQAMKAVAEFSSEASKQREQMQSLIDKIQIQTPTPEPDPIEGFLLYKGEDGRTTEVKLVRGSA